MNFSYQLYNPPDYQRDQVIGASPLPEWDVLGTTAQDAWVHNPTQAISDTADYYLAQHPEWRQPVASVAGALTGIPGVGGLAAPFQMAADKALTAPPSADAFVDAHTLNQQYGQTLGLSFDKPMRQGAVDILTSQKKAQLQRDYTLAHGAGGFWNGAASFGTQLAVSAADPLNIAAAFVPVVGEVRAGLWAERVGSTAARVGEGAVEGAVGTAAIQPIEAARDQAFQQEYGPMDAFMNVAFGSVLGGGLHAGLGKVSDLLGRLHPETREAALRGAVGQMAEGRPVDVEAAIKSDPAFGRDEPRVTPEQPSPIVDVPPEAQPAPEGAPATGSEQAPSEGTPAVSRDQGLAPEDLGSTEAALPAAQSPRPASPDFNAALDRTRTAAQDFAANREDSSLVPPGASEQAAQEVASGKGDDIDAEIEQAERTLDQYKTNGVVSEDEAKAHSDANAADTEKANTHGEAARAASACLFLHP